RCSAGRQAVGGGDDRVTEMSSLTPTAAIDYKTLVQDDRIHASLYTDPRIFDDEMERIFRRGWVFVGHDSEVPGTAISSPGASAPSRSSWCAASTAPSP